MPTEQYIYIIHIEWWKLNIGWEKWKQHLIEQKIQVLGEN